jgi:hypothetical protein
VLEALPSASLPGQPPGLEPKGPPAAAYVSCSRSGGQAWPKETLVSVGGACFDQGNLSADQVQGLDLARLEKYQVIRGILHGSKVRERALRKLACVAYPWAPPSPFQAGNPPVWGEGSRQGVAYRAYAQGSPGWIAKGSGKVQPTVP